MDTEKFLLKAQDITAMAAQHKVHFLNPNAERQAKSLGDAAGLTQIGVHLVTVAPGKETTEYHKHYYEEECLYILSGSATLRMDDDRHRVGAGDFVAFPRDTAAHTMVNDGEEPLVYLVMGQRLSHDVADYPDKGKRLYRHSGTWDLVAIEDVDVIRK